VDETTNDGAAVLGDLDDPEETAPKARGFVSKTILHQADTGEPGDSGYRRGRGGRERQRGG